MRINLFGGPNSGKSTVAGRVAAHFKERGISIEYVHEYIKSWAYMGIIPGDFDQTYIFSKQMRQENIPLRAGVSHIVTDSPLLLVAVYSQKHNDPCLEEHISMSKKFSIKYPEINIVLDRSGLNYIQEGRYENLDQAIDIDNSIKELLDRNSIKYEIFRAIDSNLIIQYLEQVLSVA